MTDERRFTEEEVAAIFERATRVDEETRQLGDGGEGSGTERRPSGMTLAEIRRIGQEVGISTEAIEASARAVAHPSEPAEVNRRMFGMPVGVSGTAELPRRLTDEEWAQLVALVRDRFSAHGKVDDAGGLKSWRNGNLRIQLEPTAEGQRLRMQTFKKSATQLMSFGSGLLGTGIVMGAISLFSGSPDAAGPFGVLTLVGSGMIGANLLGLRPWAAARRAQMEEIAECARDLASRALPGSSTPAASPAIEAGNGGEDR